MRNEARQHDSGRDPIATTKLLLHLSIHVVLLLLLRRLVGELVDEPLALLTHVFLLILGKVIETAIWIRARF